MASWKIILAPQAEDQLANLPRKQQQLICKAIERMCEDPFSGDVRALQGKRWKGRYRKRVGQYRLVFIPYHTQRQLEISAILLRSEKTYR